MNVLNWMSENPILTVIILVIVGETIYETVKVLTRKKK